MRRIVCYLTRIRKNFDKIQLFRSRIFFLGQALYYDFKNERQLKQHIKSTKTKGKHMKQLVRTALITLLLPTMSYAQQQHDHQAQQEQHQEQIGYEGHIEATGVEALSQDLRYLLIQEMKALQTGMMSIIPAYVSGNWTEIESTARKMNKSYILKQNLTESQMHELHSVLPESFIEKDQRFHYLAGMLEHAAKSKKPELINFYFSEMNESCVNCHSTFATHKFPALIAKEKKHEHGH